MAGCRNGERGTSSGMRADRGIDDMTPQEILALRCAEGPTAEPDGDRHGRVATAWKTVRHVGGSFAEPAFRQALDLARRYATGEVAIGGLLAAIAQVELLSEEAGRRMTDSVWTIAEAQRLHQVTDRFHEGRLIATALREALDPAHCLTPARRPPLEACWLTTDVVGLARAIDTGRRFDLLPILADALEDAGCTDRPLLDHCRCAGPHDPGCWTLALVSTAHRA